MYLRNASFCCYIGSTLSMSSSSSIEFSFKSSFTWYPSTSRYLISVWMLLMKLSTVLPSEIEQYLLISNTFFYIFSSMSKVVVKIEKLISMLFKPPPVAKIPKICFANWMNNLQWIMLHFTSEELKMKCFSSEINWLNSVTFYGLASSWMISATFWLHFSMWISKMSSFNDSKSVWKCGLLGLLDFDSSISSISV